LMKAYGKMKQLEKFKVIDEMSVLEIGRTWTKKLLWTWENVPKFNKNFPCMLRVLLHQLTRCNNQGYFLVLFSFLWWQKTKITWCVGH
jgi:hypothetical protein